MDEERWLAVGIGSTAAIVVAAALVPARDWLGATNVALVLALVVMVAAMVGGRLGGGCTAAVAAVSFDFFFTQPYNSLRIDKREDVIAAGLLLVLGLAVGTAAELRFGLRRERDINRRGASRLGDVVALVAAGAHLDEVWAVVRRGLIDELELEDCHFEPAPFAGDVEVLDHDGHLGGPTLHYEHGGFALPAAGVAIPVVHAGAVLGRVVLVPQPHRGTARAQRRVAVALVDELGVAAARTTPLHPLA